MKFISNELTNWDGKGITYDEAFLYSTMINLTKIIAIGVGVLLFFVMARFIFKR